ncbi:hypothetical protein CDL15_Pgr016344 [Punica granatum]|nr:hypothetical protein CDL15_Pgr016344 [Punica granatum]
MIAEGEMLVGGGRFADAEGGMLVNLQGWNAYQEQKAFRSPRAESLPIAGGGMLAGGRRFADHREQNASRGRKVHRPLGTKCPPGRNAHQGQKVRRSPGAKHSPTAGGRVLDDCWGWNAHRGQNASWVQKVRRLPRVECSPGPEGSPITRGGMLIEVRRLAGGGMLIGGGRLAGSERLADLWGRKVRRERNTRRGGKLADRQG